MTDGQLSNLEGQFNSDFSEGVLHLAPVSADWVSMTTGEQSVDSALSGTGGHAVEMEVSYRLPYSGYVRVLAGSLSAPAPAASSHIAGFFPTINVAVTQQTAGKFGLKVGSAVRTVGPPLPSSGTAPPITLKVTAIVAESQPASSFWEADPSLAVPELNVPGTSPPYWTSGVFALPDESAAVQQDYGPGFLNVQWVLPVNFSALLGDQAQPLDAALQRIVSEDPPLTGPLAAVATVVTVSTGLQQTLGAFIGAAAAFIGTAAAVDALLWLLYVSLAVTAAIVLLLAARMIVLRRATELALRRARGASLLQTGLAAGRGAAIGCVPAAVIAGAVAVLLVPGQAPPGGWWPGLAVLVVAVGAPAVLGAWQQRLPRSGRGRAAGGYSRPGQTGLSQPSLGYGALGYGRRGRRRFRGGVRLVVEVTAVLAAIAGIVVFRQQGTQPGTGVNLYTSAAPALVAIPAVIVVLRIYPLILRGLLRGAARGRSATGFLGLALAARAALTPVLPAFALVLAITVAAFAGMVRDAVTRGEINASWQAAGADVTISNAGTAGAIPAAAQHAFAAVPGVEHTAVVSEWILTAPNGALVTALAVDPASYSALVASSRTWPAVDPGLLTGDGVLASPRALADFGGDKTVTLTTDNGVRADPGPGRRDAVRHARADRRRGVRPDARVPDRARAVRRAQPHAAERAGDRHRQAHRAGEQDGARGSHHCPFGTTGAADRRAGAARRVPAVRAGTGSRCGAGAGSDAAAAGARGGGPGSHPGAAGDDGARRWAADPAGAARSAPGGHRRSGRGRRVRAGAAADRRAGDQPVGLHRLQRWRAARARRGVGRAADRRADRGGRCDADNRDTGTARRRVDPTRR